MVHPLVNRVGLVAVGHNCLIAKDPHRSINNQAGVLQLCRVKCLGADGLSVLHEHAVTAVGAPAHDEIGGHCLGPILRTSHDNSASGICIVFQFLFQRHLLHSIPSICCDC